MLAHLALTALTASSLGKDVLVAAAGGAIAGTVIGAVIGCALTSLFYMFTAGDAGHSEDTTLNIQTVLIAGALGLASGGAVGALVGLVIHAVS